MIEFTERDILRSKVVEPGWYLIKIDSFKKDLAASGKSTNYKYEGAIIKNADNGDTAFAGVPTPGSWMFNSEAIGFMVGFYEALGGEVKPGTRFREEDAVGKELDVFFENDTYQGRVVNRINHKYRKPREAEVSA